MLKRLESLAGERRLVMLPECVDEWTKSRDGCESILESFYKDMATHAFEFDITVLLARYKTIYDYVSANI